MWHIDGDEYHLLPTPATGDVNRQTFCKAYGQTAFATPGIRVLLKYLSAQQGLFILTTGIVPETPAKHRLYRSVISAAKARLREAKLNVLHSDELRSNEFVPFIIRCCVPAR